MLELSYILIYGSWISADSLFKIQRRRSSSSSATMLAQWSKISEFNWKLCLKNMFFFGLFYTESTSFPFGLPYISGAMLELSYILIYGSWISADSLFKIQRRRSSSSSATMLAQWSKISEFNWKLCLKNIVFFDSFWWSSLPFQSFLHQWCYAGGLLYSNKWKLN